MYIRRKVFSLLNVDGEDRYFSTTDYVQEGEEIRLFAEKEEKKRTKLKHVSSHRGLGRSVVLGGLPGALGGYVGKGAAEKADEEGKSDAEIVKAAGKKGRNVGAILGGAAGAANAAGVGSLPFTGKAKAAYIAGVTAGSAAMGAIGGKLGAEKNTKVRLAKRKLADADKD